VQNGVKMIGEAVRLVDSYAKALEGITGCPDRTRSDLRPACGNVVGRIGASLRQDQIRPKVYPRRLRSMEQHAPFRIGSS
jgi:hypothetical protein